MGSALSLVAINDHKMLFYEEAWEQMLTDRYYLGEYQIVEIFPPNFSIKEGSNQLSYKPF